MAQLTPSEVILFRSECFKAVDGTGVFSLYSAKSDLRKLFSEKDFSEHFEMLTRDSDHVGLTMVSESIKNNLAEVKYIERISEKGEMKTYYSKTFLTFEDGHWRILKEKRDLAG